MPQPTDTMEDGGATFDGVTVCHGATYRLPDGALVRAVVVPPAGLPVQSAIVTLHTPEEWARDALPCYLLDSAGQIVS